MAQPRFLITWVGSFEKRVIKGIDKESPDFVYFLIESRNPEWLKFQKECLKNILGECSEALRSGRRSEVLEFPSGATDYLPNGIAQTDFCVRVFSKLFEIVSQIREKAFGAEITIDITAAPRMIAFIIAFVAMVLSSKESRVKLQLIPKGFPADPKYYAPKDSNYFKSLSEGQDDTAGISLADFRRIEKEDKGGPEISIELPMVEVPLLFSRSKTSDDRTHAQVVLFQKIPSQDKKMKKSTDMLKEMSSAEKKIMNKSIESLAPGESTEKEGKNKAANSGKEMKAEEIQMVRKLISKNPALLGKLGYVIKKANTEEDELKRRQQIWISKNLAVFADLGLIQLEREKKGFTAKRTWAGDLISGVVEDKYNYLMHKLE